MFWTFLLVASTASATGSTTARGVVVEVVAPGLESAATERRLNLSRALARRGYDVGGDAARRVQRAAAISFRPALTKREEAALEQAVDHGHRLWLDGRFATAAMVLDNALAEGLEDGSRFLPSVHARTLLSRAIIVRSLAADRLGDDVRVVTLMRTLAVRFPELSTLRSDFGPRAAQLLVTARAALRTEAPGIIELEIEDDVRGFVNSVAVQARRLELPPGVHWFHGVRGQSVGVGRRVRVHSGRAEQLFIGAGWEHRLRRSADSLRYHGARSDDDALFSLATACGNIDVIVLSIAGGQARLRRYDPRRRRVTVAAVDTSKPRTWEGILDRFLATESSSVAEQSRWVPLAVVGIGVAGVAVGSLLMFIDGDGACERESCPTVRDTGTVGALTAATGLLTIVGGGMWLGWNSPGRGSPAASANGAHVGVSYGARF